jgi:hypothetical protein
VITVTVFVFGVAVYCYIIIYFPFINEHNNNNNNNNNNSFRIDCEIVPNSGLWCEFMDRLAVHVDNTVFQWAPTYVSEGHAASIFRTAAIPDDGSSVSAR